MIQWNHYTLTKASKIFTCLSRFEYLSSWIQDPVFRFFVRYATMQLQCLCTKHSNSCFRLQPASRHLISRNFSAPWSLPNRLLLLHSHRETKPFSLRWWIPSMRDICKRTSVERMQEYFSVVCTRFGIKASFRRTVICSCYPRSFYCENSIYPVCNRAQHFGFFLPDLQDWMQGRRGP